MRREGGCLFDGVCRVGEVQHPGAGDAAAESLFRCIGVIERAGQTQQPVDVVGAGGADCGLDCAVFRFGGLDDLGRQLLPRDCPQGLDAVAAIEDRGRWHDRIGVQERGEFVQSVAFFEV